MITYLTTQELTEKAADQAREENNGTHTKKGSVQCDCGESFAVFLIDDNSLNIIEEFVYCEACHDNN